MGNFFFSWPGAQIVCVCWGGVLCWGFNNRNSLCNMKIFAAKNLCSLQKLMCNYSLKPVLPSFLILARNSRWPFIAQSPALLSHLLLSLLSLPKHSFLEINAVLEVTSSFFLLGADISDHVPVLNWGMGRYRLQFRFIEEHKFLPLPRKHRAQLILNRWPLQQ